MSGQSDGESFLNWRRYLTDQYTVPGIPGAGVTLGAGRGASTAVSLLVVWWLTLAAILGLVGCNDKSGSSEAICFPLEDVRVMRREYFKLLPPGVDEDFPVVERTFDYIGLVIANPERTYHIAHYYTAWLTSTLPGASSRAVTKLLVFDYAGAFLGYYHLDPSISSIVLDGAGITLVPLKDINRHVRISFGDGLPGDPDKEDSDLVGAFVPSER